MTKALTTALVNALTADGAQPFYAVEMLFDAGAVRLWTGIGDRTIDGQTYTGSGSLLAISDLEEAADLSAKGATVTLSGISASIVSLALTEPYQGRRARILLGEASLDASLDASSTNFAEVFSGYMDVMNITHSGESVRIQLTIESKLIALQRPNVRRYTAENHKLRHPNDTFFDWVASLQDKEIAWGRKVD
jgi:hypothetical protein